MATKGYSGAGTREASTKEVLDWAKVELGIALARYGYSVYSVRLTGNEQFVVEYAPEMVEGRPVAATMEVLAASSVRELLTKLHKAMGVRVTR